MAKNTLDVTGAHGEVYAPCFRCGKVGVCSVKNASRNPDAHSLLTMQVMGWGPHKSEARCSDRAACDKRIRALRK